MQDDSRKFQFFPFLISLLITLSIGFVASLFTRPEIAGWYSQLHKPSFTPPSWLFAPVWTTLYVMIAVAAYLVWKRRNDGLNYTRAAIVYFFQLLLNFSWSIVFFGMHHVLGAAFIIVLLWIFIIWNIKVFSNYSRVAAWLLVPYLLWVSFASALNIGIYLLNK